MIIPVKCFTCGMLLADKYLYYCKEVRKIKLQNEMPLDEDIYLDENNIQKTPEGQVLDKLHLTKMYVEGIMLTHVDIE